MFAMTEAEAMPEAPSPRDTAINSMIDLLSSLTGRKPLPEHVGVVVDSIIEASSQVFLVNPMPVVAEPEPQKVIKKKGE